MWVKNVNRTLKGINTTQINDEVKKAARKYFLVHKTKKRGIQNIKKTVMTKNELQMATV